MFIIPNKKAALHKEWLYRVLEAIADEPTLASVLYFKGGTCAAMLDWLDRFSVDLDFDYAGAKEDIPKIRAAMEKIFSDLGLVVKDQSKNGIQYLLKYENSPEFRNTLKVEAAFPIPAANAYAPQRFTDIDRVFNCQTKETMFANKLAALLDRYEKRKIVAGRDVYDVCHFFSKGFDFDAAVLEEHTGMKPAEYLKLAIKFVEDKVTSTIIDHDLNYLLTTERFQAIRKTLKQDTLLFLRLAYSQITSRTL